MFRSLYERVGMVVVAGLFKIGHPRSRGKKYFDVDGQGGGVGLEVIQGHHMCIVPHYLLTQRVQYLRRHILLEQWDIMSKKFIS